MSQALREVVQGKNVGGQKFAPPTSLLFDRPQRYTGYQKAKHLLASRTHARAITARFTEVEFFPLYRLSLALVLVIYD